MFYEEVNKAIAAEEWDRLARMRKEAIRDNDLRMFENKVISRGGYWALVKIEQLSKLNDLENQKRKD